MIRAFLTISFAFLVFGFALFLWQKQVERYDFSYEKEKGLFSGVGDVVKDFNTTLEPPDEFVRNLEALQRFVSLRETSHREATTTPTSTVEGL